MQTTRRGRFAPKGSLEPNREDDHGPDANTDTQDGLRESSYHRQFPFVPESLSHTELPFIAKDLVRERSNRWKSRDRPDHSAKQKQDAEYWIVIDSVVYDCSDFASVHPGERNPILGR